MISPDADKFETCAVIWRAGEPGRYCEAEDVLNHVGLSAEGHDDTFAWVHILVKDTESVRSLLEDTADFHPVSIDDALSLRIRPGLEIRDNYIYYAIPARNGVEIGTPFYQLAFFIRKNYLLTLSYVDSQVIKECQERAVGHWAHHLPNGAELSHLVLDAVVDDFFPALDDVYDRIEELEAAVYTAVRADPKEAIELKRELLMLRKQISPLRDTLNAILRRDLGLISHNALADLQDVYDHTLRVAESIDLGRDLLSTIMDAQLNMVSNRLNEVMRTLTVISTLMMACGLIAGIYGMNFTHMPELDWRYGYPMALGAMVLSCLFIVWLFRRRNYI